MPDEQMKSNIWKFHVAKFIGSFEFVAAIFVLYLLSNNLSMAQVLLLQSFFTILIFSLEVPTGVFADLFGLKRTLALSEFCVIIGFVLYGIFSTFATFMIAEFFIALGVALKSGTDSAFMYNTLQQIKKEHRFKKIMGRIASLSMLGVGLSAAMGGYLASLFGYRTLFFVGAAFFSLGFLVLLTLIEPRLYKKVEDRNYFKHLKEGVSYSYRHHEIKKYAIYYSVFGAFTYMLFYLIQPYYENGGLPLTIIGFGVSGYFLFNALGFHLTNSISRMFKSNDKLLIYLIFIIGALFVSLKFVNVWFGMLVIFVMMFFSAIKELVVEHEVNKHCPPSHRATILSVKNMGRSLIYALSGPLVGYITDVFSLKISLLSIGITLIVFGLYITIMFSKVNNKKSKEKILNNYIKTTRTPANH